MSDFQGARCRLYIDEVGNGGRLVSSDDLNERYLSLTGIATSLDSYESRFGPGLAAFKRQFFQHVPGPVILHRREIRRREGAFSILENAEVRGRFDASLLRLLRDLPYVVFTVCLDKRAHLDLHGGWQDDPYHYCLETLVERYIQWMRVHGAEGDVAIESRNRKLDKKLKGEFRKLVETGTRTVAAKTMRTHLTSAEIKLMQKKDDCPAMQIADLLAHPSARGMRFERSGNPHPEDFGSSVSELLETSKFARHPDTMLADGWGKVWLPDENGGLEPPSIA